MNYDSLRQELKQYYLVESCKNAKKHFDDGVKKLDSLFRENMTQYDMKTTQYKVITEMIDPIIFENSPFYYETGIIPCFSDGARNFRGYENLGGWTYFKNCHKFVDFNKELWELTKRQRNELFYLVCGEYNDTAQHFQINHRPIFKYGLKGVYQKAEIALKTAETEKEKTFLKAVCEGLLCIKEISEKFASKAEKLAKQYPKNKNYELIAKTAKHCPWEKPTGFYEALNVYAFMRKVIGSLEGIGVNTFGRVDLDLFPFYENDIKSGKLLKEEAYELISKFLITFDMHYNHDMKMVGYSDHEFENTYVLGGCYKNGNPLFNDLTKMFLTANDEEKIIYPKIKCRFSHSSPKEYLDLINKPIVNGTSTILYQNDDATVPALIREGIPTDEAMDYIITGCWGVTPNCSSGEDHGSYVNILKVFEYQIHNLKDKMLKVGMTFLPIDSAQSFEEVYKITCENINVLFKERQRVLSIGAHTWNEVDPLPVFSSLYEDCLLHKKDYTDGGARYKNDQCMCVGFPNVIDSLLAIKKLCFDTKKYSLKELLCAVRNNWNGFELIRKDVLKCPGWGDGSEESISLAVRFNNDLFNMLSQLRGIYGGKVNLAHLTYTEIRFWGEKTLATPDGRFNGDYFSQGLTPSRLKKIPCVTNVINSMAALDKTGLSRNTVVNIILPGTTSLDICEAFLRITAKSSVQSLQLNCVSKETLLDAQKNPEKYPDLIVRVCGFSAKFTSLSTEWQREILSRNFYE